MYGGQQIGSLCEDHAKQHSTVSIHVGRPISVPRPWNFEGRNLNITQIFAYTFMCFVYKSLKDLYPTKQTYYTHTAETKADT